MGSYFYHARRLNYWRRKPFGSLCGFLRLSDLTQASYLTYDDYELVMQATSAVKKRPLLKVIFF